MSRKNKKVNRIDEKTVMEYTIYNLRYLFLELISDLSDYYRMVPLKKIHTRFSDIADKLKKAYTGLSDIFDTDEKTDYINSLDVLSEEIAAYVLDLDNYKRICLDNIQEVLSVRSISENADMEEISEDGSKSLAAKIREAISETEGEYFRDTIKSEILSILPLNMSKKDYNDYAHRAIEIRTADFPEDAQGVVRSFKDLFFVDCAEDFSSEFPDVEEILKPCVDILTEGNKTGDTSELSAIHTKAALRFSDIQAMAVSFYSNVIRIKVLAMYVTDSDFIFEGDMFLKDLYFALKEVFEGKNSGRDVMVILDEIQERADDEKEYRDDKYSEEDDEVTDFCTDMINNSYEISEEYHTLVNTYLIIKDMMYADVNERIMGIYCERTDSDGSTDSLPEYIDKVTSGMSEDEGNFYKRLFFRQIPCAMSDEEFYVYCENTLNEIKDKSAAAIVRERILDTLYIGTYASGSDIDSKYSNHSYSHDLLDRVAYFLGYNDEFDDDDFFYDDDDDDDFFYDDDDDDIFDDDDDDIFDDDDDIFDDDDDDIFDDDDDDDIFDDDDDDDFFYDDDDDDDIFDDDDDDISYIFKRFFNSFSDYDDEDIYDDDDILDDDDDSDE